MALQDDMSIDEFVDMYMPRMPHLEIGMDLDEGIASKHQQYLKENFDCYVLDRQRYLLTLFALFVQCILEPYNERSVFV